MKKFIWYWLPVIVYCSLIFYLSSIAISAEDLPGPVFDLKDKLLHTIEFFILGVLVFRALVAYKIKGAHYFAMMFTILYGSLDELHQFFVVGRVLSFLDLVFNGLGAIFVLWFKN